MTLEIFFRTYSLIWVGLALLIVFGFVLLSNRPKITDWFAFGGIALAMVIIWIFIHPVQTPLMGEAAEVRAQIGQGVPTLVEFQSPYCITCTQLQPIVDQLEKDTSGNLKIIRINIQSKAGREIANALNFEYTPTFIFYDAQGNELWRQIGDIDVARVKEDIK